MKDNFYDEIGMNEIRSTDSEILKRFQCWFAVNRLQPLHLWQ